MLNGMIKDDLKDMYETAVELIKKGYDGEVTKQLLNHCLSMTVWFYDKPYAKVHLQITEFQNYRRNNLDKRVRCGETVFDLPWQIKTTDTLSEMIICEVTREEFENALYNEHAPLP